MKQVLQSLSSGETEIADVPAPSVRSGQVMIASRRSLVSAGTERMLVEFGKSGFVGKARQQPDKVREVLDKVRTDGLAPTIGAVRSKLDQPLPLGYCNVGTALEVGANVEGFAPGDRVVSNGPHAEVVSVPKRLCARVPDAVSDDEAAFTVLGAISLQGVRLIGPTLGETIVVTGLGLVGLLAVQLLKANGCRVLGIDFDERKLALARQFGAETVNPANGDDCVSAAQVFSRERGVDGVLLTASTKSSEPVSQAAKMCRKRGRIVLVGVTGLGLSRADFYEKELSFQVSCSYGPGRYDPSFEDQGHDYPVGFVRWTEQRNFEAVLDMMADGRVDVRPLISHRYTIADAQDAYATLYENAEALGILIEYEGNAEGSLGERTLALPATGAAPVESPTVSFVGAGNYAGRILIPAFRAGGAALGTVVTTGGVGGSHYGRKYGFKAVSTDLQTVLEDEETDAVVVATRHDSHAALVCDALQAGKHVFVEKPLALRHEELSRIEKTYTDVNAADRAAGGGTSLMVGFNRRFAPQVIKMRKLLANVAEPKSFIMTVNAGAIPADHWTQNPEVGGGRIVGEACHFVDLLRALAGVPIAGFQATYMGDSPAVAIRSDKSTFTLEFSDGSFGTVHYLANGHKSFPKERLEVFCAGRVLQLDNFRRLTGYGWSGFSKMNLWRQDKGQGACAKAFIDSLKTGGPAPIPMDELLEVSRVVIDIQDAL